MVTAQEYRALADRVGRLEKLLGEMPETSTQESVFQRIRIAEESLERLTKSVEGLPTIFESRIVPCEEELSTLTHEFGLKFEGVLDDLRLVKRALRGVEERPASKVKVPEPKPFEGARSSKELENFLWDMETYFKASHIAENEKVSITSMYLAGDAKLWWRSRVSADASAGRDAIETWESLKKELKDQFLPCNSAFVARDAMRKLKHSGTVHEYVKEFSSLMLDIKEMTEEDKLFNFLAGLQSWAQVELRRQGVKDLQSAIAAAEGLVDFKVGGQSESSKTRMDFGKDRDKNWRSKNKCRPSDADGANESNQKSDGDRRKGCFLCKGDHLMRNCPVREKLNAILVEDEESTEAANPRVSGIQMISDGEHGDQPRREKLGKVGMSPTCGNGPKKKTWGERCESPSDDEFFPPTMRASSSFGGGGLLHP